MPRGTIETVEVNDQGIPQKMEGINPPRIFANVDGIAPKGFPIGTTAFIVEKQVILWCDGRDNWYMDPDKPFPAGQPWANLFV